MKWVDPLFDPANKYDILVIGGGAGGLVTAFGAVGTGAKVGMIERSLMGGDCLNTGCVPSKAFIKAASVAHNARTASDYGIIIGEVKVDFKAVMERMRRIRADIAEADSCKRVSTAGIDMFLG
jgi:pyruvate/2-oxoglutarate dehydrogenase complex dihydrolipoamide dehydrogenase (E3) component